MVVLVLFCTHPWHWCFTGNFTERAQVDSHLDSSLPATSSDVLIISQPKNMLLFSASYIRTHKMPNENLSHMFVFVLQNPGISPCGVCGSFIQIALKLWNVHACLVSWNQIPVVFGWIPIVFRPFHKPFSLPAVQTLLRLIWLVGNAVIVIESRPCCGF